MGLPPNCNTIYSGLLLTRTLHIGRMNKQTGKNQKSVRNVILHLVKRVNKLL